MESIQRQLMLLRPGEGPYAHPQSRGMLKLQAVQAGLAVSLTINGLPPGSYVLYLFLHDGTAIYAGDVSNNSVRQTLPGIRLKSIWGAAVIHNKSLAFCLKSTGGDWTDVSMRFKLIHAPHPAPSAAEPPGPPSAQPAPIQQPETAHIPEPEAAASLPVENPQGADEPAAAPLYMSPEYPPGAEPDTEPFEPPADLEEDEDYDPCESCPQATRRESIIPFPSVFPHSEWFKISYPGPTGWWHYITGRIYSGSNVVAKAVGVPGEYGMAPPVWLDGFGTYLRCITQDAHGYWLMFQDAETGEILDMGLSPRDA